MLTPSEFLRLSYEQKKEKLLSILRVYTSKRVAILIQEMESGKEYLEAYLDKLYTWLFDSASKQKWENKQRYMQNMVDTQNKEIIATQKEAQDAEELLLLL